MTVGITEEEEAHLQVVYAARQDLLNGENLGKQWDATQTLGHPVENATSMVIIRGAEVLAEALTRTDLDAGIRWGAAESIAHLGEAAGNTAAFALAKALLQRKPGQVVSDSYVRTGLAECIGRMGAAARGSGAVALSKALQDDRDASVRRRSAMALGHLGHIAGKLGASALVRALKVDKDLLVRCRCAEALGAVKSGEEEAKALVEALRGNETDVRWRCAMSLGKLGPMAGKEGAAALLKAHSDRVVAVREHAMRAANMAVARCLEVLEELVHPYIRGLALWFLGSVGPRRESTEALVAVMLREEVYLRRRACEGLGCQGQGMGALGALALRRAVEEDPDVYIQWHASQIYQQLPAELQAKAESSEASEELKSLVAKDALRQQELKKQRKGTVIPRWEPELPEPPPEEEAPLLPDMAMERQRPAEITTPQELKSPSGPSPTVPANMDAWANSPLSPQTPIEPEAEVVKSFVDTARSRDVFRAFAEGGEINREDLYKALKMLGHVEVNNEWVSAIVKDKFSDRNFLDALDFSKFLAEYEACHMNYVRMKFAEADVDGSGRVDAAELAQVLRRAGFTPITGVVEQLLLEVCPRAMEVTFVNFAKILGIMRYRLGFTLQEYSEIMAAFRREDRSGREKLNLLEARSCLDWLGFDISQEDLEAVWHEDLKVQAQANSSQTEEEYGINDFDMVRLVRAVREREAHFVARRLRELATRKGQELPEDAAAVVTKAQLPELLSELNVTLASPDVMLEAVEALKLSKAELTMEDIMPVLWHVRRYQGLSQTELDLAKQQFELCDEDGSGGMACSELEFAIRSLGFPVSYDEVQDQLDIWDMDESGEIEFVEFLKVVSYYKKKELQQVLQNMFTGSFSLSLQKNMTQRRFSKAGELKRGKSELPSMLLSSGHCPLRQDSGVLRSTEEDETELNLWGFSNLISEYRREINDEVRRNHGYTPGEVEELMQLFRVYDPENQGVIAKRQLRRLLLDCVPQAEKSQAGREQIAQMIKESDADRSGSIDFQEFLLLMRLVSNRCSRERLAKERAAVVATHFSVRDLREFRKVFKSYATNSSGDMSFEELQSMLGSITRAAQGARGSQELLEILRRYSQGDNAVDFPEFLHVMRDLVAHNWGNINALTAKAPPPEPTPEVDALLPPPAPPPPEPPDPPAEAEAQAASG